MRVTNVGVHFSQGSLGIACVCNCDGAFLKTKCARPPGALARAPTRALMKSGVRLTGYAVRVWVWVGGVPHSIGAGWSHAPLEQKAHAHTRAILGQCGHFVRETYLS